MLVVVHFSAPASKHQIYVLFCDVIFVLAWGELRWGIEACLNRIVSELAPYIPWTDLNSNDLPE
jgi:hypothetical protein